jgi:peptidoglycan hydrolase-like protein with peptidoglycan-binding domain
VAATSTPTSTSTTTSMTPAPAGIRRGGRGPAVTALQARLSELGYCTGEADGTFGWDTHHAVVAVQKAARPERDGIVGPATRRAPDVGVRPEARSRAGHVVDIDLAR